MNLKKIIAIEAENTRLRLERRKAPVVPAYGRDPDAAHHCGIALKHRMYHARLERERQFRWFVFNVILAGVVMVLLVIEIVRFISLL